MAFSKLSRRTKIRQSIRAKIKGTAERPRLCVFRSNKAIYAQIIDDVAGHTLAASSSRTPGIASSGSKSEVAKLVGMDLAAKGKAKGVASVVFDRGGYLSHGRIKSLAEGAREGGLEF